jgi:exonuclease III
MKLISLNTWGGRASKENLLQFIEKHKDVDVFCLQEMWNGGEHMAGKITGGAELQDIAFRLLTDMGHILKDHEVYFRPHYGDWYGLAMFVKKDKKVIEEGELFVYKERGWAHKEDEGNHARNIQYVTMETAEGLRTIVNFHGLWNGQGKGDSDDRLLQSDNILNFVKNITNPQVICGDFNLRPDTQSLKKFEDSGFRNLIKEYGITSTRTSLYTKPEKFADYTFVSDGITVNNFEILPEEVSDHAAMYLDFN